MIRISGIGAPTTANGPRRAARAADAFRVGAAPDASQSAGVSAPAPVETLSALIALQSEAGGRGASRAKALAAARQTLDLLDRLRLGLVEGAMSLGDVDALETLVRRARGGDVSEGEPEDPGLAALQEEIVLRARVELAKLGR
mgnify:CR=1 FL=1